MMFTSRVIDILQIKYPIIQAGMAGAITTPELVAAVSNSGGLGTLGAGYMSPEQIRKAIYKIRELTNKPFGVNLLLTKEVQIEKEKINEAKVLLNGVNRELGIEEEDVVNLPKSYKEQLQVLVEEKVPVVSFAFQTLEQEEIDELKRRGIKVIGTATHVAEARALAELGVDIIAGQGSEAGGHRGTFIGKEQDAIDWYVCVNSAVSSGSSAYPNCCSRWCNERTRACCGICVRGRSCSNGISFFNE